MKKKSFKGGIDGLLMGPEPRPDLAKKNSKASYSVATWRIEEPVMENIKRMSYWMVGKPSITLIVNEALKDHVTEYVRKHGELKPIPVSEYEKKHKDD